MKKKTLSQLRNKVAIGLSAVVLEQFYSFPLKRLSYASGLIVNSSLTEIWLVNKNSPLHLSNRLEGSGNIGCGRFNNQSSY